MTEKLLIRLDQSAEHAVHWLICSSVDEQIIASGSLTAVTELAQLTEKAKDREVVLLLSAAQVQLKTVELPAKWNRKLEQALPFILEEQIACDIDEVFIAVGQPTMLGEQHAIQVAICEQAYLAQSLALLDEYDIAPRTVLPDALLLPAQEEGVLAMLELGNQWLCRLGQWHIGALEKSWGADYLHALSPEQIVHYSPADAVPDVAPKVAKEEEYDVPLALLAKQLPEQAFTLRQQQFAMKKSTPQWWKDWQSGLIAAGVALVCFTIVQGAQVYLLNQKADEYKAQAIATYKQAFPKKVIRPALLKRQINSELSSLSGTEQGGFLELTDHFVSAYAQVKGFQPETLRYDQRRNELRIRVKAKDFQVFGKVKAILEQKGLTVQEGSLNNDGESVVGEIRLRGEA